MLWRRLIDLEKKDLGGFICRTSWTKDLSQKEATTGPTGRQIPAQG
jgi:hypothetical protein